MIGNIRHAAAYYTKIYIKIFNIYIKTRLSYRADFMIGFIGMIVKCFSGIITLSIIFSNIPQIAGWRFYDLLFFYSLSSIATMPIDVFFPNIWNLHNHIIQGTFTKYCLKPINTMFYYFSEVVEIKNMMQLFISIPLIIYSGGKIGADWNIRNIAIIVAYFVCSSVILTSFYIIAGSLGFWITNSMSILNFINQVTRFSQYPLSIYGGIFKFLFSYIVPIGFVAYYPTLVILGKKNPSNLIEGCILAIVFVLISTKVWTKGVEHYSGTGS